MNITSTALKILHLTQVSFPRNPCSTELRASMFSSKTLNYLNKKLNKYKEITHPVLLI